MIKIRPKVAIFAAFSRLNYKPWFALAEFVDNSVQSFLSNRKAIESVDGCGAKLTVALQLEDSRITVHDTAAGIRHEEFSRAFMPAQRPPDTSGLSEFGLGMKAAACWFAKQWTVRTCALGDGVERVIKFNVPEIVANDIEEVAVSENRGVSKTWHFTSLVLEDLNQKVRGATIPKVKSHLAGIYRSFIADGTVKIVVNSEELDFKPPSILVAPYYKTPVSEPVEWKKTNLKIELDDVHHVTGWAALREKLSTTDSGFAVFRRGRVILGSGDVPYRPKEIFGSPNKHRYMRLVGELHVEGFDVSHTKDGLLWDEWEGAVLEELKRQLDAEPLKLIAQADWYRSSGVSRVEDDANLGTQAADHTAEALRQHAGPVVSRQLGADPEPETPPPENLPPARVIARREVTFDVEHDGRRWRVIIELAPEPGVEDWYSFSRRNIEGEGISEVTVRVSLSHPFTERFALKDEEEIEPLIRIAAGLALAEVAAIDVGVSKRIKTMRHNFNQLLREALSK
ncbi:MAG: ATP-binding protein [Planctomycetes bacterium]|nr:ATP-binding protein [Planctomycetota bacterium]